MQDLNSKVTGSKLTASEFNEPMSEIQQAITDSGQTLSSGDLTQLSKATSANVANKAAAVLLTPVNNKLYFIGGTDGGLFKGVTGAAASTYSDNGGAYCGTEFIPTGGDGSAGWLRVDGGNINAKWFGAVGDEVTDCVTSIGLWLDYIIANPVQGVLLDGTFLCSSTITKTVTSKLKIRGNGVLKASGTARLEHIVFDTITDTIDIDGITIDGNNITARSLVLESQSVALVDIADVILGSGLKIINTKGGSGFATANGVRIYGGFRKVFFDGLIDTVDNSLTTGGITGGISVNAAGGGEDYTRTFVCGSNSRFIDIKNDNTVLADADGLKATAGTGHTETTLIVSAGAYFENCKGRAIKSQMSNNSIIAPNIYRDAYDGLAEIDVQYAGGVVSNANIVQDGYTSPNTILASYRTAPLNKQMSIKDNILTVLGTPATDGVSMVELVTTDNAIPIVNGEITGNKAYGTLDYCVSVRAANVSGNRVTIRDNWVDNVNTAFALFWRYGSGTPITNVNVSGNACANSVTGRTLTNTALNVEDETANYNITRFGTVLDQYTISTGSIAPIRRRNLDYFSIDTEADAASDDLDTITGTNFAVGDVLIVSANSSSRTVVLKDATGNLQLSGDITLDNAQDTAALVWNGGNWLEVSNANNGV